MNTRRSGRIGALLLVISLGLISVRPARACDTPAYEPDEVVVKLARLPGNKIRLINRSYGTRTKARLYRSTDTFLLQTLPGTDVEALVELMAGDVRLIYAELNYIDETPENGGTDRIYGWGGFDDGPRHTQEAVDLIGLEGAHDLSRGTDSVVAVVDTGVQLDHPALADSLHARRYDFVDNDLVPEDEANGLDDDCDEIPDELYGHGTHIAGIVDLVAPEALIMPVRVLNSDGRGNNFTTANGISFAAANGADVINLSLGTEVQSLFLRDVVEKAANLGAVVVAAAGNLNSDAEQYPAAEPCAAAVTSVDINLQKSSFANFGDWIGVATPGEGIYSTFPVSGYATGSGTSMSTPFVAGQVALLRSVNPSLTLDEVGLLVGGTAESLDPTNPDYTGLLGKGLIDILTSLEYQAQGIWPEPEYNLFANCGL